MLVRSLVVGAGIRRVVFAGDPPEGWALDVLRAAGVELVQMPDVFATADRD